MNNKILSSLMVLGSAIMAVPAFAANATSTAIAGVGETIASTAYTLLLDIFTSSSLWLAVIPIVLLFMIIGWTQGFFRRKKGKR